MLLKALCSSHQTIEGQATGVTGTALCEPHVPLFRAAARSGPQEGGRGSLFPPPLQNEAPGSAAVSSEATADQAGLSGQVRL